MSYQRNLGRIPATSVVVVKNKPVIEVARAMIESGHQMEPFYIFDFDAAYKNVQRFRKKLPQVQIFYAMKANDYSMMLKLAISLGLGFDCASPGEINKIRKYNVCPSKIIYAAPMKTPQDMTFARESGVKYTTFDSFCELNRLNKHWPDSRPLIRVKLDSDSVYKLGNKFGCDYAEAVRLLDEAARLGIKVVGVAFHVGSVCYSKESYTEGLRIARALFDREARAGRKMTMLDIGGGFIDGTPEMFDEVSNVIYSGLEKWFSDPGIQIIAEPGRHMCESAFTLYTNIRDIRTVTNSGKNVDMVYLNNGTHGALRYIEKWYTISKFQRTKDIERTKDVSQNTIICGPTSADNDFWGPVELAPTSVNDWLVFCLQEAYCSVFKTKFCCTEETLTRSIISTNLWTALKDHPVFSSSVFMMDSEVPPLLPSTLPPVHINDEKYVVDEKDYLIDFQSIVTPAYVLEHHSPDDVARAMIESGQQMQPFYVFNMDEADRRVQHFKKMLPRVKIFYAVRSNDTDMMLRLAAALDLGFGCASPGEIHKIRKLNVDPQRIIYVLPCKTTQEMEYARQAGVRQTTFDSLFELLKLQKTWPDARLLLRIRIDGTAKTYSGLKFGCDFKSEATELLDKAASLGLKVVGVAFHVGSTCSSTESYVIGLQLARALFDHEAKNGRRMDIVDIGGGFLSDKTDRIDKVSHLINATLEELFPDPTVQIIAEPGRYLSDSAFKLFCNVIGVRQVTRNDVPVNMIYMSNGFYGTMRFDENWHKLYKFQRSTEIEPILEEETIIWGPTCDCTDQIMKDYRVRLPRCAPGDWLVVDIHGAYTFTFSTRFSCLEIPLIRSVISKDLWNCVKTSAIFESSDFVQNPDVSAPLPSSLPLVLSADDVFENWKISKLNV